MAICTEGAAANSVSERSQPGTALLDLGIKGGKP